MTVQRTEAPSPNDSHREQKLRPQMTPARTPRTRIPRSSSFSSRASAERLTRASTKSRTPPLTRSPPPERFVPSIEKSGASRSFRVRTALRRPRKKCRARARARVDPAEDDQSGSGTDRKMLTTLIKVRAGNNSRNRDGPEPEPEPGLSACGRNYILVGLRHSLASTAERYVDELERNAGRGRGLGLGYVSGTSSV
jgi:hypothetical protein